ncbi:MAG: Stk1 family PASTA domain-containing Ser/Thr kinase [Clostridia bacterium]
MNLIGSVLSNRYEIIEQIGEGGMAYVYKAKCRLLNRYVAVKVLKEEYSSDISFVKRFKIEAQAAASLTCPNIVSVYDVGQEDNINYIVMELLESRTLKDYIEEKGCLSNDETLKISMQIATALEVAHKEKIIHRDIKPQNIVLSKNLVAKVTDFGIAKAVTSNTITNFGTTMGSVHYFSPEHAKGGYTDEKSDIYSLGVVMYEMATGKVPFDGDSSVSIALKHIQEEVISPKNINSNITAELNDIILKAMSKISVNRYSSATDMLVDIKCAMNLNDNKQVIEAGATQVIPIITDEDMDIPNLRTKNSRRMRVIPRSELDKISKENNEKMEEKAEEKTEKNLKKGKMSKKKLYIIIAVVAVIMLSVISFFVIKIVNKMSSDNQEKLYTIPNLVDRKFDDVVKEYTDLEILQDKAEYDDKIKEGNVISQDKKVGEQTKDKKIYVIVSKGQKIVEVPDVVTKDIKIAKYELQDTLGFKIEIEEVVNEKVNIGVIISQQPKKGESAPYGSVIKLKISKGDGKARVIMPDVINKNEADATKTLKDLKLVPTTKFGEDKSKSNGVVIKQSYPTNQELKEGDLVEITINKLLISKVISLDLIALQGGNSSVNDIVVKVVASIDESAENTVFDKTFKPTATNADFTLNGYKTAVLKIYIDKKLVDTQTINF